MRWPRAGVAIFFLLETERRFMANLKGCFSHKSDHWATPDFIYGFYVDRCGFFDPCPLHSDFDGLVIEWPKNVFVNPPYSDVLSWVRKALGEYCRLLRLWDEPSIVLLLPCRTDTEWFRLLAEFGCEILFIRGRLKFGGSKLGAPFPSMIVRLNENVYDVSLNERVNWFDVVTVEQLRGFTNAAS